MPPVTMTSWSPARIIASAISTARIEEAQTLLIVSAPISFGMPAPIEAWRPGAWPTPAWSTSPMITYSTSSGSSSARSRAALIAIAPSCGASYPARPPPSLPNGVRAVETMTDRLIHLSVTTPMQATELGARGRFVTPATLELEMDHLAAVGDPELREALLFARGQARPTTADDLAQATGVHRNVARSRLERLVAAGLLAVGYERRTGRVGPGSGRPAKTYSVVPQLESIEFPGQTESLMALLVDALAESRGGRPLREVGVAFGRELARAA